MIYWLPFFSCSNIWRNLLFPTRGRRHRLLFRRWLLLEVRFVFDLFAITLENPVQNRQDLPSFRRSQLLPDQSSYRLFFSSSSSDQQISVGFDDGFVARVDEDFGFVFPTERVDQTGESPVFRDSVIVVGDRRPSFLQSLIGSHDRRLESRIPVRISYQSGAIEFSVEGILDLHRVHG